MDALLDDLRNDPLEQQRLKSSERRRKRFVILLVLMAIIIPVGVWYGLRYRTFQLCKDAQGELVGVWDDTTKASVQKAFLGTKKNYALDTWERVERTIDRYLMDWKLMRSDVCEAKLIRGTQSEELFDLRMSCLQKRIEELGALF